MPGAYPRCRVSPPPHPLTLLQQVPHIDSGSSKLWERSWVARLAGYPTIAHWFVVPISGFVSSSLAASPTDRPYSGRSGSDGSLPTVLRSHTCHLHKSSRFEQKLLRWHPNSPSPNVYSPKFTVRTVFAPRVLFHTNPTCIHCIITFLPSFLLATWLLYIYYTFWFVIFIDSNGIQHMIIFFSISTALAYIRMCASTRNTLLSVRAPEIFQVHRRWVIHTIAHPALIPLAFVRPVEFNKKSSTCILGGRYKKHN